LKNPSVKVQPLIIFFIPFFAQSIRRWKNVEYHDVSHYGKISHSTLMPNILFFALLIRNR
jgi:hypothetical protein